MVTTTAHPAQAAAHTCRDEVLAAFRRLELRHGRQVFRLSEIVAEVKAVGTRYRDSTIRTHVGSLMCAAMPRITMPSSTTISSG
jgi:hypothetical protein